MLKDEKFEVAELFEKRVLFTDMRIRDRSSLPEGIYAYDIRHDDECQGDWVQIQPHVLVNYWGTVLSYGPLDLGKDNSRLICEDDWGYLDERMTIDEFIISENMKKETCMTCCEADVPKRQNSGYCVHKGVVYVNDIACEHYIRGAWKDRIRLRKEKENECFAK